MTGGGFGGSAIVLAEGAAVDEITERVEAAFSRHGFRRPSGHTVTPRGGPGGCEAARALSACPGGRRAERLGRWTSPRMCRG